MDILNDRFLMADPHPDPHRELQTMISINLETWKELLQSIWKATSEKTVVPKAAIGTRRSCTHNIKTSKVCSKVIHQPYRVAKEQTQSIRSCAHRFKHRHGCNLLDKEATAFTKQGSERENIFSLYLEYAGNVMYLLHRFQTCSYWGDMVKGAFVEEM